MSDPVTWGAAAVAIIAAIGAQIIGIIVALRNSSRIDASEKRAEKRTLQQEVRADERDRKHTGQLNEIGHQVNSNNEALQAKVDAGVDIQKSMQTRIDELLKARELEWHYTEFLKSRLPPGELEPPPAIPPGPPRPPAASDPDTEKKE